MNTLRRIVYQLSRRLHGPECYFCGGSGVAIAAIYSNALLLHNCPCCHGTGYCR